MLPRSVHGNGERHGFIPQLVARARDKGICGYLGDGTNRWPAVHVKDAAVLYRLAVEQAPAGAVLNAVGDEGVAVRDIAEAIGSQLNVPAESQAPTAVQPAAVPPARPRHARVQHLHATAAGLETETHRAHRRHQSRSLLHLTDDVSPGWRRVGFAGDVGDLLFSVNGRSFVAIIGSPARPPASGERRPPTTRTCARRRARPPAATQSAAARLRPIAVVARARASPLDRPDGGTCVFGDRRRGSVGRPPPGPGASAEQSRSSKPRPVRATEAPVGATDPPSPSGGSFSAGGGVGRSGKGRGRAG